MSYAALLPAAQVSDSTSANLVSKMQGVDPSKVPLFGGKLPFQYIPLNEHGVAIFPPHPPPPGNYPPPQDVWKLFSFKVGDRKVPGGACGGGVGSRCWEGIQLTCPTPTKKIFRHTALEMKTMHFFSRIPYLLIIIIYIYTYLYYIYTYYYMYLLCFY